MNLHECNRLSGEYFYLLNAEYLDRQSGNKCQLVQLEAIKTIGEEADYTLMCKFLDRTSGLIGAHFYVPLDAFLNGDRFLRIRMAPLHSLF